MCQGLNWSNFSRLHQNYINLNWTMISQTKACITKSSCVDKKIQQGKTTVNTLMMELNPPHNASLQKFFIGNFNV